MVPAQDGLCERAMIKQILIIPIKFYRLVISPLSGPCCRFYPTCSTYALEAVERHGVLKGLALAIWRILRCHPWYKGACCDPVPERFTWGDMFGYKRGDQKILNEQQEELR